MKFLRQKRQNLKIFRSKSGCPSYNQRFTDNSKFQKRKAFLQPFIVHIAKNILV